MTKQHGKFVLVHNPFARQAFDVILIIPIDDVMAAIFDRCNCLITEFYECLFVRDPGAGYNNVATEITMDRIDSVESTSIEAEVLNGIIEH
ncbi:MAG: hypothetical protein A3J94_07765 [Syntrophus sp. RIFOXYC2_FULL_54_9]|nr:MAG: hypothetical protein A3J94_07765 [Syntrophus sp. RIFOXYC2_FULL_54_9]